MPAACFCPVSGRGRALGLFRNSGISTIVISNIAVIHGLSLPSGQELFAQMEQPGKLQRPLHLFLPLRLQVGTQGV